jgi:hypothetical protein
MLTNVMATTKSSSSSDTQIEMGLDDATEGEADTGTDVGAEDTVTRYIANHHRHGVIVDVLFTGTIHS